MEPEISILYIMTEDVLNEEFSNTGYWYKQKYIIYNVVYPMRL
jgi:hypothetical protein